MVKAKELEKGTKVTYGFFSNITFEGIVGNEVILKDKMGNEKRVFISLFEKYGKVDK